LLALSLTHAGRPTVTWKEFCDAQDQFEAARGVPQLTDDHATHISMMAAMIFGAMLAPLFEKNAVVDNATLKTMRKRAIVQAQMLWLETLASDG
jgi:hypothetical protein